MKSNIPGRFIEVEKAISEYLQISPQTFKKEQFDPSLGLYKKMSSFGKDVSDQSLFG